MLLWRRTSSPTICRAMKRSGLKRETEEAARVGAARPGSVVLDRIRTSKGPRRSRVVHRLSNTPAGRRNLSDCVLVARHRAPNQWARRWAYPLVKSSNVRKGNTGMALCDVRNVLAHHFGTGRRFLEVDEVRARSTRSSEQASQVLKVWRSIDFASYLLPFSGSAGFLNRS